eukprot:CAMPEP_0195284456 /NCGR_PEP_ID=MMETSP0707-20130614/2648_1 /TAXON_ID=33640 /ORGANISM="Asterionellopsis glacialis, Strain CCMP134" /LENGTH=298 /DNA_ID=CAMNT_0040343803 /DNA_START=82 /DNA_END=975 /DNA_ORIENTATION=-
MTSRNTAAKPAVSSSGTVIPPTISSGWNRRKYQIYTAWIFLTIVYVVVYKYVEGLNWTVAPQFCSSSEEECHRPELAAFQAVSCIMMYYMGLFGIQSWHFTLAALGQVPSSDNEKKKNNHHHNHNNRMATPEQRIFGFLPQADELLVGIFVYQTWDFVISITIPEHSSLIFLAHHAFSGFMAWYSLEYQVVHYYAIYFGGVSEFSSIFLVVVDLDVYFPPSDPQSAYATFIFGCQVLFLLTFIIYRVVGWWYVASQLWKDAAYVTRHKLIDQYRPGKGYFIFIFTTLSVLMGLLQLYW